MPSTYWLDANVFIQAKNGLYAFDIAPGFWKAIEFFAEKQVIRCPIQIRDELTGAGDELSRWVRSRSGIFVRADKQVQRQVGEIAQRVQSNYGAPHAQHFLSHADPWVVAHASVSRGIVITEETLAPANSQKVKIPNVCKRFGIPCKNTSALLRSLEIRLEFNRS